MIRRFDWKILILLLLNAGFAFVLGALNTIVAPYVYLILPAIFIVPAARCLGFGAMIFVVALSGFFASVQTPLAVGIIPAIWLLVAGVLRVFGVGAGRLDAFRAVAFSEMANFAIIIIYALIMPNDVGSFLDYCARVCVDAAVSALVLLCVARLVVDLPMQISLLLGLEQGAEDDAL